MRNWEQRKADIIEQLNKVSTIFFVGDTGMGKSLMAKEISECTINDGLCDSTFWVYVTEKYDTHMFYKDIDRQLCLSSITEEWEYEEEETVSNLEPDEKLKERKEKLKQIGNTLDVGKMKYLLLVLDDVGNDLISNAELQVKLSEDWMSLFPSKFRNLLKIIIITKQLGDRNAQQSSDVILFPLDLQPEGLSQLLQKRVNKRVSENRSFQKLVRAIAEKSEGKPAAIIVIAKTLNYIDLAEPPSELRSAILKAAYYEKTSQVVNPLFYCACDMIKSSVTRNCFWHCIYLFCNYGGVHYDELISHWIMEGYLDTLGPFDRVEEAYWKGYDVLMELIDRGLLKIQENNFIVVEEGVLSVIDSSPLEFNGNTALRLFSVFKENRSLGRVRRMNGMIKTFCNPEFWKKNSTLLMDGSHITGEVRHQPIFDSTKELKVLAVFKAGCDQSLISSLSKMDKLLVLVLRTCDLCLEDIGHIKELKTLKVLEISGNKNLSSFPDELFDGMTDLQSLNLSGLQIKSLSSLPNLRELRYLILGQLSCLKEVQSLKELVNLEILDLAGASSLESMPSDLFDETTNLQSLNLSELQVESLPSFSKLTKLRVLILRGCSRLKKLQSLRGLGKLELLDISDATSFESFDDPTLSVIPKIRKIGLSNTNIQSLPEFGELKELTQIFLSGCRNLRNLPKLQLLTSLQILDLSGAIKFTTFKDQSIENLDRLTILDLSRTSITKVPDIPRSLLELNLMDCEVLEQLPSTVYRENLRTNDVAGYKAAKAI